MSFKNQINEDIEFIQSEYVLNEPKLEKSDFAFNYWVLSRLYNIDEEVIDSSITEYRDDGVDCYVYFEDLKELYIIQNKFHGKDNKLDYRYVQNDFLHKPISTLLNDKYTRSKKLQTIFNKNKDNCEFKIFLRLYITNDLRDQSTMNIIKKYQGIDGLNCIVEAQIYYLEDIRNLYFNDRIIEKKNFNCDLMTINKGTVLNINSESYKLPGMIDAKYIFTPVTQIHRIVEEANEKGYGLFEENIREYLGNKGVNAKIINTLNDENDRNNFFYYNNGITIICKKIANNDSIRNSKYNKIFKVYNPQIVNGCQTVNTINNVLSKIPEEDLEEKFKDTYVMVKLLVLNAKQEEDKQLYKDIVRYNNSQNKIDEKNFEASKGLYTNLQRDFEKLGFLLLTKQSDKFQFKQNKNFNDFRPKVTEVGKLFGLEFNNLESIMISLEKLLQVILAFSKGGYDAFTKKNRVLKFEDSINMSIIEYIEEGQLTRKDLLYLYLLYLKCEKAKKASEDKRTPISYYVVGFLGSEFRHENENFVDSFRYVFQSQKTIESIYKYYSNLSRVYKEKMISTKGYEYNELIKAKIDKDIQYSARSNVNSMMSANFNQDYFIYKELMQKIRGYKS
ncbi:AIPR protein [Candidatus Izimaplasma bacterium HR1]|jgi:hypothetical protein|uniref:AIPR family protein n=1 Tax=Candidatus Izimoplasma sp. HR1 TaxID=1541959 RepID=UPI0004F5C269|nr:AIPR protein [Candidatus Izimaplasma bacterium HR1]